MKIVPAPFEVERFVYSFLWHRKRLRDYMFYILFISLLRGSYFPFREDISDYEYIIDLKSTFSFLAPDINAGSTPNLYQ